MKWVAFSLTIITFLFITSCYYDNEEALYPVLNSGCDTLSVTFTGTIVPILNSSCYSCHSNGSAASSGNGILLENYSDVKSNAAAVSGSIKHTGGYSPMPKNGGKLKNCSITQFDLWVQKGMLNN